MTCRDVSGLLPLFYDGELDARQMRAVALHSSRCPQCEADLRRFERVQELVNDTINARLDELDLSQIWPNLEKRLAAVRISWWQRLRWRWEEYEVQSWLSVPALGMATAAAVLAITLWTSRIADAPQVAQAPAAPSVIDNTASIDSLESTAESVAVVSEPETNTTVLWVNDDTDYGSEGFPP
ncbi:MAG TPA: zf-HC2 domain-containing protein [Candidatus Kryptonia bacterium]|nr:zf-HC2 domain-containing protein [Candidatus Kryptonia bacterium]